MSNLYENDSYEVILSDNVLGEDNQYGQAGYAVRNKETQVVEHTTMLYPQAIFQADALSGAWRQLKEGPQDAEAIEGVESDVVIN
jgi:hypothetical protein